MNEYNSKKDKIEIFFMKIKLKIQKFFKTKFGAYLWQIVSSALILLVAAGIGIFAAYAKTEGSAETYAKEYFKYFMTHSWSLMYKETDLQTSAYINEESFGEMMKNIVPEHGSDNYKFVDQGTDGEYHLIDVVYQETGSDVKHTMTLRMKKKAEKRLFILDQWQVCMSDEMIQNCTISAPAYVSVAFDGVSLAECPYEDNEETGLRTYTIDKTLAGTHKVELSTYGTIDVSETFLWESSREGYTIQTTEFPLDSDTIAASADKTIDIIVGMYTAVLTNAGSDAVKEYFVTEDTKAAADVIYQKVLSEINREDGSTLVSMSFDSYNTEVCDYVSAQSFAVRFTFDTTFSAKGSRTVTNGVRKSYDGTTQGVAVVHFVCMDGQWQPYTIEMSCFDYSEQEEPAE
jgi:hypothetical protein